MANDTFSYTDNSTDVRAQTSDVRELSPGAGATAEPSLRIRPVRPSDAAGLQAAFERMSPLSRYYRFHSGMRRLPDALLRYLTNVDGVDHVALVATERWGSLPPSGVGIARFVRLRDAPDTAEVAIAVADYAQGRGIGRRLLSELGAVARRQGITHFTMAVLAGNRRVRRWLASIEGSGTGTDAGVITFRVPVAAIEARAGRTYAQVA